ncbi:MAG: ThuA domain-containing protein [Verrucomicrobiales bacterium]
MRKLPLVAAALTLASVCLVVAQKAKDEEPKTWKEKAAARFGENPTLDEQAAIEGAVPRPSARRPDSDRKILLFYRCEGFIHTSIPYANHALKAIADKTGVFTVDLADEYSVFFGENLEQYDAIVFNNTTNLVPNQNQQQALLDFVNGGKGIVGLHAAADNFREWDEGVAMMGGIFNGHPWTQNGTWAFKVEDPDHVLNAAFNGKGFWHKDEIYWYKPESFQGRERLRVLLSLDMSKAENAKPLRNEKFEEAMEGKAPKALDVPVSWCREIGKGRLFYTNLGHNDMTFANRQMLQHMLDGIQYAIGDLDADATPSAEVSVEVVPASDNPE